ncbi:MAG: 2'-5' RNA ligase family protein [Anaerolineales bacterium]|jgi:2'-5' RNA ligase
MQSETERINPGYESSLVILVPEAELVVRPFREKHDPSASQGMPAHITINYPFQVDLSSRQNVFDKLAALCSRYQPFRFLFSRVDQLPGVLYLEPDPVYPFIELIQAVAEEFPESPPYKGEFSKVIPHLTVAQSDNEDDLQKIKSQFIEFSRRQLPIDVSARTVNLMNNRGGTWAVQKNFPLAGLTVKKKLRTQTSG